MSITFIGWNSNTSLTNWILYVNDLFNGGIDVNNIWIFMDMFKTLGLVSSLNIAYFGNMFVFLKWK